MNKTPPIYTDQLKLLALKLKENHDFLAWVLSTYQQKEHIDEERLVAQLKTTPEMLVRLALCKRPNPNSSTFASQIREISTYTNTDPIDLANIIRQVDALEIFSKIQNNKKESTETIGRLVPGLLAAARDKLDGEEDENKNYRKESDDSTGGKDVAG